MKKATKKDRTTKYNSHHVPWLSILIVTLIFEQTIKKLNPLVQIL